MTTPVAEAHVRRPHRALVLTISLILAALVGAGCSGGGDGDGDGDGGRGDSGRQGRELALNLRAGNVVGGLATKRRYAVVSQVGSAVDDWFETAYLGGTYPRKAASFRGSWPHWTRGLRHQARAQSGLTSNAAIASDTRAVVGRSKLVRVDVLAWKGKQSAATARFVLVFDQRSKQTWRHKVHGRLMLLPVGKGRWEVVGYDINRSRRVLGGGRG